MTPSPPTQCELAGRCSGCPWIERPLGEQTADKRRALTDALGTASPGLVEVRTAGASGLRTRVDLSIRDGVMGLYDMDRKGLVDIQTCPALTPALDAWLREFRSRPIPIERASVRLRVSPDGQRGVWIDAANVDVKRLLDDAQWLAWLDERAVVEIGQRRKRAWLSDRWRLKDPELGPWFRTWLDDDRPSPLFVPVGGFTQPSDIANRLLVGRVLSAVDAAAEGGALSVLELGAGAGNLTLPIAARGHRVTAVETDTLAVDGLRHAATVAGEDIAARITVRRASFYDVFRVDGSGEPILGRADLLVADPPRSGLGKTLDGLAALAPALRPTRMVYVSCFLPALERDVARLTGFGYRVTMATGVDQFPQTPHMEWVLRLRR